MGKTQSQYLISWDYNNMVSLQKRKTVVTMPILEI